MKNVDVTPPKAAGSVAISAVEPFVRPSTSKVVRLPTGMVMNPGSTCATNGSASSSATPASADSGGTNSAEIWRLCPTGTLIVEGVRTRFARSKMVISEASTVFARDGGSVAVTIVEPISFAVPSIVTLEKPAGRVTVAGTEAAAFEDATRIVSGASAGWPTLIVSVKREPFATCSLGGEIL